MNNELKVHKSKASDFLKEIHLIIRGFKLICHVGSGKLMIYKLLSSMFSSIYPFVNIYLSARIINELSYGGSSEILINLVIMTVIMNLAAQFIIILFSRLDGIWTNSFNLSYTMLYSNKMMEMDYKDVEDAEIQSLRSRISEIENFSNRGIRYLFMQISVLTKSFFQIVAATGLSFTFFIHKTTKENELASFLDSPATVIIVIIFLALFVIFSSILTKKETSAYGGDSSEATLLANRMIYFYNVNISNDISVGKDIRIYNLSDVLSEELSSFLNVFNSFLRKFFGSHSRIFAARNTITYAISGVIYILVVLKAMYGAYGVGNIVQYVGAISQLSMGILALAGSLSGTLGNNEYLRLVFKFLDIQNTKHSGNIPIESNSVEKYEIEFRNVSFKYDRAESYALKNINLKITTGDKLAIVGENGSGKTTLVKLLSRLYDPTEGEILLNGMNIKDYDYDRYQALFSIVFQDFKLFAFSLGQNVAASKVYDSESVKSALNAVEFNDRLTKFPKGLDHYLFKDYDESGEDISGGEAQKIAIARAIYKSAPFIVMDEPTAALDPIAEMEIYEKFNKNTTDKTVIYITHRLASCRFCNRIIVFDNGYLTQDGAHDILLEDLSGKYYELWQAQAQHYSYISCEK